MFYRNLKIAIKTCDTFSILRDYVPKPNLRFPKNVWDTPLAVRLREKDYKMGLKI